MNAESIADKIKRYRKINNMSQEELSTLSGINVSTVKKYECGYRNPKPEQLVKIANALNVSVLVFLSFDLTTTSDILALLIKLAENSDLEIECQKDNSDNYVTNTISLSFKDPVINQTLVRYLKYKKALESSANSSAESASDLQRQLDELLICKK